MTLFELSLRSLGFDLPAAQREMTALGELSRAELDTWTSERRQDIVRYHLANNPLYRAKVNGSAHGEWESLPVMAKADFQADLMSIATPEVRQKMYRSNTSGSSGHPFHFGKDRYTHACTWALVLQRYGWHGLSPEARQARFYGSPLEPWSLAFERAKDRLMRRVRFRVFDLSPSRLDAFAETFKRTPFEYIYGYTSSLVLFARHLLDRGWQAKTLCPSLKACITTSEVCTAHDRAVLVEAFGTNVVNEYGASEVGVIAFESTDGDWVISEENLYIEVVDDNGRPVPDGTPGNLLITDLRNLALPFIRYQVGDVGAIRTLPGPRGRRCLVSLDGRTNDVARLPSGKTAAGMTFYYISRSILESSGVLREFVVRQTSLADFRFDVVSDQPISAETTEEIRRIVDRYLEPGLNVEINRVPAIDRTASGKLKHFHSSL